MEFGKIIINCLGASNTRIIKTAEKETVRDVNYPVILGLLLRCTVRNYGVSGTNIAVCEGREDSYFERAALMERDADVVIIQGDGNDASHCLPLGEKGSRDVHDYRGALAATILLIRENFPNAAILAFSGMPKLKPPRKRTDGLTHDDFHRAFTEVCRENGIEPYDFSADPVIRADDEEIMPDGLHLSEKGCRYYAEIAAGEVRRVLGLPKM